MNKYHIIFFGRLNGALGICYRCSKTVVANSEDEARLKLYETHEHISDVKVTVL